MLKQKTGILGQDHTLFWKDLLLTKVNEQRALPKDEKGGFLCRRRSGSSDTRIASVPFKSDGLALVRWLTRGHDASVVKPIEKQNKSVKRRRRETP